MKNLREQIVRALLGMVIVCVTVTTATASPGNYNQQGPKLVGTGAVGASGQGASVALSADGNTALVGGPDDNPMTVPTINGPIIEGIGAAWVFVRSNGAWSQQGDKLVGTDATITARRRGSSVGLSGDGNTAVVGTDSGAFVFTRSGGVWTQQGPLLAGNRQTTAGDNVAISSDGNTLFESNSFDVVGAGCKVFVFTRSDGSWTQQGSALVFPDYLAPNPNSVAYFGLALSGDGNTLAVGEVGLSVDANGEGTSFTALFVATRLGGVWTSQQLAFGFTNGGGDFFSTSLTSDGNTLLTGGTFFYRRHGVWSRSSIQLSANGRVPTVLSADGNTAVGDLGDNRNVAAFVRTGGWHLQQTISGSGAVGNAGQGSSIALSANGDTMIEGGQLDNSSLNPNFGVGAAWVFAAPQLATTLTHSGDFHQGQTGATYTMTVKNVGDRAIHAALSSTVILVDRLPSGLTATNIQGDGWTCTVSTATCTRDDGLAVGASYPPVTVTVDVASNAPATIVNLATGKGGGSNWGNAFDPTTILP